MKRFFYRHQPPMNVRSAIMAGAGAALTLSFLGFLGYATGNLWLIAPFGASAVLLFAAPSAVFSQPVNLLCGHALASAIALVLVAIAPDHVWLAAVAAGLSIAAMVLLRVVHPPAGATALVAYLTHADWTFFFVPVLAGSIWLIAFAWGWHKTNGGTYPLDAPP